MTPTLSLASLGHPCQRFVLKDRLAACGEAARPSKESEHLRGLSWEENKGSTAALLSSSTLLCASTFLQFLPVVSHYLISSVSIGCKIQAKGPCQNTCHCHSKAIHLEPPMAKYYSHNRVHAGSFTSMLEEQRLDHKPIHVSSCVTSRCPRVKQIGGLKEKRSNWT